MEYQPSRKKLTPKDGPRTLKNNSNKKFNGRSATKPGVATKRGQLYKVLSDDHHNHKHPSSAYSYSDISCKSKTRKNSRKHNVMNESCVRPYQIGDRQTDEISVRLKT